MLIGACCHHCCHHCVVIVVVITVVIIAFIIAVIIVVLSSLVLYVKRAPVCVFVSDKLHADCCCVCSLV
jgi:type IV secretory pathway TrbL component